MTAIHRRMVLVAVLGTALIAALATQAVAAPGDAVPGYRYGDRTLPRSPVSLQDLELLQRALLFTDEDVKYLRRAGTILRPQIEDVLDVWYGFVGSHPHLLHYFSNKKTGEPEAEYLARVRRRFGKWIEDTTDANYDQTWLDWQHEIGVRHHVTGKNKADDAPSVDHIHL